MKLKTLVAALCLISTPLTVSADSLIQQANKSKVVRIATITNVKQALIRLSSLLKSS